ncbi:MAG: peptidylprolyl isomerase [Lachnospiraceae bacterium]|nr:peptidylprolyl isomerase [Lachnospiraceae bacterium]
MAKRCLTILMILSLLFCGCAAPADSKETEPQEESSASSEGGSKALLKVGEETLPLKIAQIFALSQKQQYETAFGSSIWKVEYQGRTFEQTLKDNFRTHIALMFTSFCLAKYEGLTLSAEEEKTLREAANACFDQLDAEDVRILQVSSADTEEALRMYLMAKKIYRQTAGSVELDLSEDETRVISLQEIRISTEGLEGVEKDQKLTLAAEALNMLEKGEEFTKVAEKYSDTGAGIYSASRETLTNAETKAAFALATDEYSPVVTLSNAYVIFYCVDSFDKAASEMRRMELLQDMVDQGYKEKINRFLGGHPLIWNEANWNAIEIADYEGPAAASIYAVYEKYFPEVP